MFGELCKAYKAGAGGTGIEQVVYTWIEVGTFKVELAFHLDTLSAVMILMITGVGSLIHIYSTGYMAPTRGTRAFFGYLNLFTGAMLILVLGSNLPVMFIGWEGVGLCSYLLIGFWYENEDYATAGRKAFVVNRIGDFCFLLGMFLLFWATKTLDFGQLNEAAGRRGVRPAVLGRRAPRGGRRHLPVHRRVRQERAASAVRLAARRDGGSDAGLRADPRGDDGHRRRLHGLPAVVPVLGVDHGDDRGRRRSAC